MNTILLLLVTFLFFTVMFSPTLLASILKHEKIIWIGLINTLLIAITLTVRYFTAYIDKEKFIQNVVYDNPAERVIALILFVSVIVILANRKDTKIKS